MNKVSITWISTWLYCKRKLYLEQVRNFKVENEAFEIKSELKKRVFDDINSADKRIVVSFNSFKSLEDIQMVFRKEYYKIIQGIVNENRIKLFNIGLNVTDFFHEIWPSALEEAKTRSNNLFSFILKEKIYSDELWSKLYPRYLSNVYFNNNKIEGVLEKVELYQDYSIPIKVRTGKAPKEGVWPSDKVLMEIFIYLTEKEFGKKVEHGIINYLGSEEVRKVSKSEHAEEFMSLLLEDLNNTLKGSLPGFVKNRKKCDKCPLKERCYALGE